MNDVNARKTVYKIAFRNGGSNANPLLNCAGGGRIMLNTTTDAITTGRGIATIRLGFQCGGMVAEVRPTCSVEVGSGMCLFVLGKGHRPVIRGVFGHELPWTSGYEALVICQE